ncbi:hypothetical protein CPB86DRAFT_863471, partial [Serendipita vermifera]
MTGSSVGRTPLEIWHLILRYAIASPLLPFVDENALSTSLMDNLHMFSTNCQHYRIYRDVTQDIIERLRLVCRTWDKLLQSNSKDVAISDLDYNHYTSVQMNKHARRIHFWTQNVCKCKSLPPRNTCKFYQGPHPRIQEWMERSEDEQSLQRQIPNVRILVWDCPWISSLKFLGPLSNLTALSLYSHEYTNSTWSMQQLRIYAVRLTHLHVQNLDEASKLLSEEFSHPNIRYLSLRIEYSRDMTSHESVMNWTLPSLETLRIHGFVHPRIRKGINAFLFRHSEHLEGLDLEYLVFENLHFILAHIPPELWEICPNLTRLSIHCDLILQPIELLGRGRESHGWSSIELLHYGVFNHCDLQVSDLASIYQDLIRRWNITRIISAKPWNRHSMTGLKLFQQLAETEHIPITDHFHVPIEDVLREL